MSEKPRILWAQKIPPIDGYHYIETGMSSDERVKDQADYKNAVPLVELSAYQKLEKERDEWKETWTEAIRWKPYLHFCMTAWDGLLIDRTDAEFDACTCFEHKPERIK